MMQYRSLIDAADRARELGGLTISTTIHAPGSVLPAHAHERDYFCFVTAGRFAERAGGGSHRCAADTLVFHPAGDIHADAFDTRTRCLNLELPPELGLAAGELRDAFARRDQRRSLVLAAVGHRLHRELDRGDAASGLAIQGLVLELAAEWARVDPAPRRPPAWLAEATRIVRAEYASHLECRDVAARVGVHPVRLSREFKRAHRVTMTALIARLRVDHAAHLLRTTRRPLASIALEAGFADQSHLAKAFRRHTGTTCARYRAVHPGPSCKPVQDPRDAAAMLRG
jgi:AraC family transcriptional regulator